MRGLLALLLLLAIMASSCVRRACFDVPVLMRWQDGTTSTLILHECVPVIHAQPRP